MVLNDINSIIDAIRTSDDNTARKLLKDYAEIKATKCVENAWKYFFIVFKRMKNHRANELRKHVINFNEESDCISLLEFTRYFAMVEAEIYKNLDRELTPREYAAEIQSAMYSGLGSLKIDKRIIYRRD